MTGDVEIDCHMCGIGTDFYCRDCENPVCENCCVMPTYMNQLDYSLCKECGDFQDANRAEEYDRQWEAEEAEKEKKAIESSKRKAAYRKPENVEKRRLAKIVLLEERAARRKEFIREANEVLASFAKYF